MLTKVKDTVKFLLQVLVANSETPIFLSKSQLASHPLQFRASATKSLADTVNRSLPKFLQVSFNLLGEVALCSSVQHHTTTL